MKDQLSPTLIWSALMQIIACVLSFNLSEPDSELYMVHVSFGSVSRLSMTQIIASLASLRR